MIKVPFGRPDITKQEIQAVVKVLKNQYLHMALYQISLRNYLLNLQGVDLQRQFLHAPQVCISFILQIKLKQVMK